MFQKSLTAFLVSLFCGVVQANPTVQLEKAPIPTEIKETQKPALSPAEAPQTGQQPAVPQPVVQQPAAVPAEAPKIAVAQIQPVKAEPPSLETKPIVPNSGTSASVAAEQKTAPVQNAPVEEEDKTSLLIPHRATYKVSLYSISPEKNQEGQTIAEANGQMTIQIAKAGDGWASEQKLTLHIYYTDGSVEQVITHLATYETFDGLKYNFNERTVRGDQEEVVSGDAVLASSGGAGVVTYQQPDESMVQLPVGTVFPTQHLITMLGAAKKGQKVVSSIVFDGTSETHEPVQVDTILGAPQDPKLAVSNKELFNAKKVWPMRMAIYPVDNNAPDPQADYEINQQVLSGGVIRDMISDYGTFKVKAVLTDVDVFS